MSEPSQRETHGGFLFFSSDLPEKDRREIIDDLFAFTDINFRSNSARMGVLLFLSTTLATFGFLNNSTAVIIGAMLIAPIMRPILAAAAAGVMGWRSRLIQSFAVLIVMTGMVISLAALYTWLTPEVVIIPSELLARTNPTLYDLVIALAAGAAAAYTLTRKETSAVPGVAVAISLLPPLAGCGILLACGMPRYAASAFLLFATNLAAMLLSAQIIFLLTGFTPRHLIKASSNEIRQHLLAGVASVLLVSIPLYFYSVDKWFDDWRFAKQSDALQGWLQEHEFQMTDVRLDETADTILLKVRGANIPNAKALFESLTSQEPELSENVKIQLRWLRERELTWPDDSIAKAPTDP